MNLPGDTTPGTVTQADYDVWKTNFGMTAGSGSGSAGASPSRGVVPEPATAVLLIVPLAALSLFSHREPREQGGETKDSFLRVLRALW